MEWNIFAEEDERKATWFSHLDGCKRGLRFSWGTVRLGSSPSTPMKTHPSRVFRFAFTLVELLVVIGIIVILMGMLLGVIPAIRNSARKAEARQTAATITVATNAYYTDYAKFPSVEDSSNPRPPGDAKDTVVGDPRYAAETPNNALFFTLRNIPKGPNQNGVQNPRKVVYYEGKGATVGASDQPRSGFFDRTVQGAVPDKDRDGCLYDPWGFQYGVVLDTTGDERIDLKDFYTDFTGNDPAAGKAPRRRSGAFSVGKDGMPGKHGNRLYKDGADQSDDIVSFD
jgi:type II secretory pathway pseudopilin PulG